MKRHALGFIALVTAVGCSSDSPVAPVASPLGTTIQAAHVLLGGQHVEGQTVAGERGQTLFQVMLRDRDALHLANVQHCEVRYQVPGMGRMMAPARAGTAACYDDGTHGDDVAGDGTYHYLDADDAIGCGRVGMPAGSYEYEFHCEFADGSTSQMMLGVSRR